jgi:hypothetical protein
VDFLVEHLQIISKIVDACLAWCIWQVFSGALAGL